MPQYIFGAGNMWGIPLQDASGVAITNPTPVPIGTLQDISADFSFEVKKLYGQKQFPVAVGRAKGSMSFKAKSADIDAAAWNSLYFGQTLAAGLVDDVIAIVGVAIPTTPFQITPVPPNSGAWSADLGVVNTAGLRFTRVASAPTTGQYSVTAGVYTFASADNGSGMSVLINYQYTAALPSSARKLTVTNLDMGLIPTFRAELYTKYLGKTLVLSIPSAVSTKLSLSTKLDDFAIPEFDFEGFADATGNVMTFSISG